MFQLTDNLGLTAILPPPKADNMAHTEDSVQVRDMSLCATLRITTTRIRLVRGPTIPGPQPRWGGNGE